MNFSLEQKEKNFLLVFFASFTALYFLIQLLPLEGLLQAIAGVQAQMLNSIGIGASAWQTTIFTPTMEFEIIRDCSGLLMVALLAALLLASGNDYKKSLSTLLLYAPFLLAFNLLRLLATLFVGAQFGQGVLEAVHFALWIVDSAVVLMVWAKSEGIEITKIVNA